MKNKITCQGCGRGLNAAGMSPRSTAACPNCGNTVTVPFPGMKAGKFAGLYFGSWVAYAMALAVMGQAGAILIPVWFGFKLWIGYLRAVNIGWGPVASLLVILPFIGAIVLACYKTGEGAKRTA